MTSTWLDTGNRKGGRCIQGVWGLMLGSDFLTKHSVQYCNWNDRIRHGMKLEYMGNSDTLDLSSMWIPERIQRVVAMNWVIKSCSVFTQKKMAEKVAVYMVKQHRQEILWCWGMKIVSFFFLLYYFYFFIFIFLVVNFMYQLDMDHTASRYLVKRYTGYFCESVVDETKIKISRLSKAYFHPNVGGPYPNSWKSLYITKGLNKRKFLLPDCMQAGRATSACLQTRTTPSVSWISILLTHYRSWDFQLP